MTSDLRLGLAIVNFLSHFYSISGTEIYITRTRVRVAGNTGTLCEISYSYEPHVGWSLAPEPAISDPKGRQVAYDLVKVLNGNTSDLRTG